MFWAMMYILFFSNSAAPELLVPNETKFQNAIKDQQRLERILAIHNEVKSTEQALSEMFENQYENLAHLSPQHEIGINQFQNIFEELNSAREEAQALWLVKRFQMKE